MTVAQQDTTPDGAFELARMGEVLSELGSYEHTLRAVPELSEAVLTARLSIVEAMMHFTVERPEIIDYYRSVAASQEEVVGEEAHYEAGIFLEIFAPDVLAELHAEPEPDDLEVAEELEETEQQQEAMETVMYIDGREFTRDPAVIALVDVLRKSKAPMRSEELRQTPFGTYIEKDGGGTNVAEFKRIQNRLNTALVDAFGTVDAFVIAGKTRGKNYYLDLGDKTVMTSLSAAVAPTVELPVSQPARVKKPAAKAAPAVENSNDQDVALPPAPEPSEAPDAVEAPSVSEVPSPVAIKKIEIKIRGQIYEFTPLQKQILEGVAAGNHRIRDIVAHLQNGNSLADEDFFKTEFLPQLDDLHGYRVDSKPLVVMKRDPDIGKPIPEYHLPEGARFETVRGETTLRFVDPSTTTPNPEKQSRRSKRRDLIHEHETQEPGAPLLSKRQRAEARVKTKMEQQPKSPSHLDGVHLHLASGEKIKLEPYVAKLLVKLSDGSRYTLDDLASHLSDQAVHDKTLNAVISGDLTDLQRHLGSDALRRKQKQGQPARWWLSPDSLVIVPTA